MNEENATQSVSPNPERPAYDPAPYESPAPRTHAQKVLAAIIVAYALGALLYIFLHKKHLDQTGLMFIGIPLVLAFVLALSPRPESAKGSILRGIALALLLIAPLLGEGYLCILMASPLFFAVGLIIGSIVDWARGKKGATLTCISIAMLPFCLEGIVPQLTHNRAQTATVTSIVDAPSGAVEAALTQSPHIDTPLPYFLRIGFPRPLAAHGDGLVVGSERTIHFAGAEGDPPGDLTMRVTEARPGYVCFTTTGDTSKLTQWMIWRGSEVAYKATDATHTRVTWTIHFERRLDPWWYFAPWEQYAVRDAAKYLLSANATPRRP